MHESYERRTTTNSIFTQQSANVAPGIFSGPTGRTTVAVLADEPVIAHGLNGLIRRAAVFDVVAATTNLTDVSEIVARGRARVVVVSLSTAADDRIRWTLDSLREAAAAAGELVGTVCIVPPRAGVAAKNVGLGASAVVTTEDGVDSLTQAIFDARFRRLLPAHLARSAGARVDVRSGSKGAGRSPLTPRELEVLQGMADGLSTTHIAEQLGLSVHTVRTHVQRVLPKLGVHTRVRAVTVAFEQGLLTSRKTSQPGYLSTAQAQARRSGETAG